MISLKRLTEVKKLLFFSKGRPFNVRTCINDRRPKEAIDQWSCRGQENPMMKYYTNSGRIPDFLLERSPHLKIGILNYQAIEGTLFCKTYTKP